MRFTSSRSSSLSTVLARVACLVSAVVLLTSCELSSSSPPPPPPVVSGIPATPVQIATGDEPIDPDIADDPQGENAADATTTDDGGDQIASVTNDATAPADVPLFPEGFPLTIEQASQGWIALFDGHSLFGWEANDPGVNWSVADGVITADTGPIGLLNTAVPFADYELLCDFNLADGGNSGIFLRTLTSPMNVATDCYELNMAQTHPEGFTTGSIVGHIATEAAPASPDEWHTFRVICEGAHIQVELDGAPILDYTDPNAVRSSGYIGLQKNAGRIAFRNVLLRPIGLEPLFNGSDLAGWREVPGGVSEFAVVDETIHCTNGAGFLETEQTFGNFIFQADSRTNSPLLNSGYFFRAMEGTAETPSHGYEVQIHNGFVDGDREKPENAGSGAIFRRVEARRVTANDGEWQTTTLVAHGNRIMTWVNGYAVVDWTDDREPNDNPREGRRDAAGHISLQGHDPTTDVNFRNLQAMELPE